MSTEEMESEGIEGSAAREVAGVGAGKDPLTDAVKDLVAREVAAIFAFKDSLDEGLTQPEILERVNGLILDILRIASASVGTETNERLKLKRRVDRIESALRKEKIIPRAE